ncbi:MAG: helix-turn-helix domain-containing protein [Thermoplasmata archaeon]
MRRLTVEVNWEDAWCAVLGPHYDDVQILEVLRTFKCDADGFALTCKMTIRDESVRPEDLAGNGILSTAETLYQEEDGSWTVYLVGKFPDPGGLPEFGNWKPVLAGTPQFVDVDRMRGTFLMNEDELGRFQAISRRYSEKYGAEFPLRILAVSSLKPEADSGLSRLTGKQRKALLLAYTLGYYDVPRRISSEGLARRLNVNKSTLVEHLRKGQRRLLSGILSG